MKKNKYRAWDGIRMTTSGIMFNTSTGELETPLFASISGNPIKYELMQFVGLEDISKKDVYEKDIITIKLKNSPFKIKCTVIYNQSQCQFMAMEMTKKKLVYQLHRNRNIEVIGNMFENPELL